MTTTDFSKFGYRERVEAEKLLKAWNKGGLPNDFYDDDVQIMMNQNSGYVFLTNSDYQVAMFNGDKLESFYTTPYEGREGFFEDLKEEYKDMVDEDKEYFKDLEKSLKNNNLNGILTNGIINAKTKNMNGFSRMVVEPSQEMNGFSRVNYKMNGYTLNDGYMLSGSCGDGNVNGYTLNGRTGRKIKRWYRKNAPLSYIATGLLALTVVDIATGGKVREMVGIKKKTKRRK